MLRNVQLNLIHREYVGLGRIVRTILLDLNKKFWFSFTNLNPFFKEIITISYKKNGFKLVNENQNFLLDLTKWF